MRGLTSLNGYFNKELKLFLFVKVWWMNTNYVYALNETYRSLTYLNARLEVLTTVIWGNSLFLNVMLPKMSALVYLIVCGDNPMAIVTIQFSQHTNI
jgi:hypothetical protein